MTTPIPHICHLDEARPSDLSATHGHLPGKSGSTLLSFTNHDKRNRLVHQLDHAVDVTLTVTSVTTLDVVGELLALESTVGVRQLEGPQELVGVLEIGASSGDLVNQVLDRDDSVLAQVLLDEGVGGDGQTLAVDLGVSTLVDQVADRGNGGLSVSHVRLNQLQHLLGGLGQLDEDTVVDLDQSEELEDLPRLGGDVVDTTQTDDEGDLGLGRDVEVARGLGSTAQTDLLTLTSLSLLDVLLSTLEDDSALVLLGLQ